MLDRRKAQARDSKGDRVVLVVGGARTMLQLAQRRVVGCRDVWTWSDCQGRPRSGGGHGAVHPALCHFRRFSTKGAFDSRSATSNTTIARLKLLSLIRRHQVNDAQRLPGVGSSSALVDRVVRLNEGNP